MNNYNWKVLVLAFLINCVLSVNVVNGQEDDDLLSLLGEEEETTNYTYATFKTTRIINMHSVENNAAGVLDIKISHRFGNLNGGLYELFGIDQASIRIAGEYGLTDRLMIGLGRSSFEKTYDGFLKYKILRQSTGKKVMPVSASFFASTAIETVEWSNPDRDNKFTSRLSYTFQVLLARKFNESLSLQLTPTLVHRNLVQTTEDFNDMYALGVGGRMKLTKRISLNAEYIYLFQNSAANDLTNSLSLGIDIETGGHVFQLHFTNSTAMIEKGFVAENRGSWLDGDVRFGFNVSRVFTLKRK